MGREKIWNTRCRRRKVYEKFISPILTESGHGFWEDDFPECDFQFYPFRRAGDYD